MTPRLAALKAAFGAASGTCVTLPDRAALAGFLAREAASAGIAAYFADPDLPPVVLPPGVARISPAEAGTARPAGPLLCALSVDATLGDRPVPGLFERYPGRRRMMHLSTRLALVVAAEPPPLTAERLAALPGDVTFVAGPSRTADIEKVVVLGAHGPAAATLAFVLDAGRTGEL